MKIAVWHNLPSGGGKRALYNHVKGLVSFGHCVKSWCPSTASQSYLPLGDIIPERILSLDVPSRPSRRYSRGSLTWEFQKVTRLLKAMEDHCRACAEEINQEGFDAVFANSCTFFRTSSIGRFVTAPSILYLQEPYRWLYEALPQLPWVAPPSTAGGSLSVRLLKERAKDLLRVSALRIQVREEINNAKSFSRILANSLFSRESILRAYGLDSAVCYLGIDVEAFPFYDGPRKTQIISVGLLYYGKGAERSLHAISLLPREIRPKLLWVGNGGDPSYVSKIEQLARDLEVEFTFHSNVSDADLVKHLQESFAMIYTPRLEPFGYVPLEANCCGLPVVGIAEGGLRETLQDGVNGYVVPGEAPELLAKALGKLLNDQTKTEEMRMTGRKLAETKWNNHAAVQRLESELSAISKLGNNRTSTT